MNNFVSWKKILEEIQLEIEPIAFSSFFKKTSLLKKNNAWEIVCPNNGICFVLEKKYKTLITKKIQKHLGKKGVVVRTTLSQASQKNQNKDLGPLFPKKSDPSIILEKSGINPSFTFENYAVSVSNQIAHAAAHTAAQSPGKLYNPLFIWGGVGVGKTHLLHAVGKKIIELGKQRVLYCSAEDFTNLLIESIRNRSTSMFRRRFRNLDALLIDDIQFISQRDFVQEELFNTFNKLYTRKKQIVFASDKPPKAIKNIEHRLTSRFLSGLVVDVQKPDFELKTAILLIKTKQKGINIDVDGAKIIAGTIGDLREIEGFLLKLYALHSSGTPITNILIEQLLSRQRINTETKTTGTKDILKAVSRETSISLKEIQGPLRKKDVSFARHLCMYFLKTTTSLTYEDIARIMGRKDHTTVMHGVQKIMKEISNNENTRRTVNKIKLYFS